MTGRDSGCLACIASDHRWLADSLHALVPTSAVEGITEDPIGSDTLADRLRADVWRPSAP